MDVEEQGEQSRVLAGGSAGSVSVSLHPLVIMNISDHFTRVRVQQEEGGPLLGVHLLDTIAASSLCLWQGLSTKLSF